MWGWGWGHGVGMVPFWWMGVGFRLIFLAAVVTGIVFVVRGISRRGRSGGWTGHGESALDILQKRYARGELSKEELEEMKRNLG
jgi:putative membrane protein